MEKRRAFLYVLIGTLVGAAVTVGGSVFYTKKTTLPLPPTTSGDLRTLNVATTSPQKFKNIPVPKSLASESYYNVFNKTLAEGTELSLILNSKVLPLSSDLLGRWKKKDYSDIINLIISVKLALNDVDASAKRLLENALALANLNKNTNDKVFYDGTTEFINAAKVYASAAEKFVESYNGTLKGDQPTAFAVQDVQVKADALTLAGKEFFAAVSNLTAYFLEKGNIKTK